MNIQEAIQRAVGFFGEVGVELRKSNWPTRAELQESTAVVILSVVALGAFIAISDFVLMRILKIIL